MVEEILFFEKPNFNTSAQRSISKVLSRFILKLNNFSFCIIILASIIFVYSVKCKSRADRDKTKYDKIIDSSILVIICALSCSIIGLLVDFLANNFIPFLIQDDLSSSISKLVSAGFITYLMSISTFYLWKLPTAIIVILFIFFVVMGLVFLFDNFSNNPKTCMILLSMTSFFIWLGYDLKSIKEKASEIINDFYATLKYISEIRNYVQVAAFKLSFAFSVPVILILNKVAMTNVSGFTLWSYSFILQFVYNVYVNFNARMIVYYESADDKNFFSIMFDVVYTSLYHQIIDLYNIFVDVTGFIGLSQIFELQRIESHKYASLIDFIERSPKTIQKITEIQENSFLNWTKLSSFFLLIPIHLSLYMIKFYPDLFDTLCSFFKSGPLSIPFSLIRHVSLGISLESSFTFISYVILIQFFVVVEYSFICSKLIHLLQKPEIVNDNLPEKITQFATNFINIDDNAFSALSASPKKCGLKSIVSSSRSLSQ